MFCINNSYVKEIIKHLNMINPKFLRQILLASYNTLKKIYASLTFFSYSRWGRLPSPAFFTDLYSKAKNLIRSYSFGRKEYVITDKYLVYPVTT